MDSTPNQTLTPQSIKASASKLPIKRKTPHPHPSPNPNPSFAPILAPKLEPTTDDGVAVGVEEEDEVDRGGGGGGDRTQPPFKFHRIWTEPDEIRFLQGLLGCSSDSLSFPRDLGIFYARFSGTMSQPYTKSQLSEKLRRLRKKFRVISSRLARGLDKALLSPQDRALFELSEQLWHPDFSSTSPFSGGNKPKKSNLVGVKVSFSPTLPSASILISNQPITHQLNFHDASNAENILSVDDDDQDVGVDGDGDVKLREVNIGFDGSVGKQELPMPSGSGIDIVESSLIEVAAKTVINVFDQCFKEVRMAQLYPDQGRSAGAGSSKDRKVGDFETRWREQRVAELDVLGRRLRLVLENSLQRQ